MYRVALVVNLSASAGDVRDTGSILGREDPLEKEMAAHSSMLASRISSFSRTTSWTEEPDGLHTVHGVAQSWTRLKWLNTHRMMTTWVPFSFSLFKFYFFYQFLSWIIFIFWLCCAACGILVPWPGMEPMPPTVETQVLITGLQEKFPYSVSIMTWVTYIVNDYHNFS